ncbi:hypothetical protein EV122DRAFT_284862 [Schizophyllum commune]
MSLEYGTIREDVRQSDIPEAIAAYGALSTASRQLDLLHNLNMDTEGNFKKALEKLWTEFNKRPLIEANKDQFSSISSEVESMIDVVIHATQEWSLDMTDTTIPLAKGPVILQPAEQLHMHKNLRKSTEDRSRSPQQTLPESEPMISSNPSVSTMRWSTGTFGQVSDDDRDDATSCSNPTADTGDVPSQPASGSQEHRNQSSVSTVSSIIDSYLDRNPEDQKSSSNPQQYSARILSSDSGPIQFARTNRYSTDSEPEAAQGSSRRDEQDSDSDREDEDED